MSGRSGDGTVVIFEGRAPVDGAGRPEDDDLWVSGASLEAVSGWTLKPEGVCRGDVCVPVPPGRTGEFVRGGDASFNLAAFARLRGQPVVRDEDAGVWAFGLPTAELAVAAATGLAPDFTLPDLEGREHTLSAYRGRKVVLYAWSSWCSCRWHLPLWAALHAELAPEGFVLLAIATDGGGAAATQEWIRAAAPTHPSLLDETHLVTQLYGLTNVPNTVWIDEEGRIVRPAEAAGMTDVTGAMDRATLTMSEADQADEARAREAYLDAIRDWVRTGRHALEPEAVARAATPRTEASATAAAHHRIGRHLLARGAQDAASRHFARAVALEPDSWMLRRDAWGLRNAALEGSWMMSPSSPLWQEFFDALDDPGTRTFYPPTLLD